MNPEAVPPASWMTTKARICHSARTLSSWAPKNAPADFSGRQACFDIFSRDRPQRSGQPTRSARFQRDKYCAKVDLDLGRDCGLIPLRLAWSPAELTVSDLIPQFAGRCLPRARNLAQRSHSASFGKAPPHPPYVSQSPIPRLRPKYQSTFPPGAITPLTWRPSCCSSAGRQGTS